VIVFAGGFSRVTTRTRPFSTVSVAQKDEVDKALLLRFVALADA
jgi:hypothetical protein